MDIRRAIPEDSQLLSSLCADVQNLHATNLPDIFIMPQSESFAASFFDNLLADPQFTIFIAQEGQLALGYIACQVLERPQNPFAFKVKALLVDQISVRSEARTKGVGSALIQQAETLAKELGIQRIQLDSWAFNTGAHEFFEKRGFEKYNFRFWKFI